MIISEVNMLNTMQPKENVKIPDEESLIKPVDSTTEVGKKPDVTSSEEAARKRQQLQQLGKTAGEIDKYDGGGIGDENAVYDGKEIYNEKGEIETLDNPRGNTIDTKV